MPYVWDNTEADQYGIKVGYAKLHYIYVTLVYMRAETHDTMWNN